RLYGRGEWRAPGDGLILAVLWPIGLAYLAGEGLVDLLWPQAGALLAVPLLYGLVRELFRPHPQLLTAAAVLAVTLVYWGGLLALANWYRALAQGLGWCEGLVGAAGGADNAADCSGC